MSDVKQFRVKVEFQDGSEKDFRYARSVGFNEFGAMVIEFPRDINGRVLIPFALPGMFVKWASIEEEIIVQVPAKIITS